MLQIAGMTFSDDSRANGTTRRETRPARCLVTGGAGFIGCHLVRLLLDRGHAVRVLDLQSSPGLDPRAEFVEGSILDESLLRPAMAGIGQMYHLAANPNLWAPDKRTFQKTNHRGTQLVLAAAAEAGVQRIVHTSTELTLVGRRGRRGAAPIDEKVRRRLGDMPGAYSRSKFLAEQAAIEAAARGVPVVIVNPTLPVGPGDWRITPPTRMILEFLNGDDPAYMDFEMNLIDVRDAALGHVLAAASGRAGERYILGGENVRMSRLLEMLNGLSGLPMPQIRVPFALALAFARVSEWTADYISRKSPKASVAGVRIAAASMALDCSRAGRELGLEPRPVRDALGAEIAWLHEQGLIHRPLPAAAVAALDSFRAGR
jgi:dihydroflavonol-4-reductase